MENGTVGDPSSWYDRVVLAVFGVAFQLAEVLLIVGAFMYAGVKTNSPLLTGIAQALGIIGATWLGLIIPSWIGRLGLKNLPWWLWLPTTLVMLGGSILAGYFYLEAIKAIAVANV